MCSKLFERCTCKKLAGIEIKPSTVCIATENVIEKIPTFHLEDDLTL